MPSSAKNILQFEQPQDSCISSYQNSVCSSKFKTAVNSGIIDFSPKFMVAIRGCNSVVECHLPMVNVVGSSPIARFKSTLTNYLSLLTD